MTRSSSNISERRFPRVFLIVTPVLIALLMVLLVEVVLALFYPVPFGIERNMQYVADAVTGYRLKPGGVGQYGTIPAVANEHGHRDDPVTLSKPEGVYRILVLGDSFTVGAGVAQDDAWPQVLERWLDENMTVPVEVINAAVGGWEPLQYLRYFETEGRRFQPDLVLVGFFVGNDTFDRSTSADQFLTAAGGRRITREAARSPFVQLRVWLYEHSHLMRLLTSPHAPRGRGFGREQCDAFRPRHLAVQKAHLENHRRRTPESDTRAQAGIEQIQRLQRAVEQAGARFGLVMIPDENQINPGLQTALLNDSERADYDFDMPQTMLNEHWAAGGTAVIDLLDLFRDDPRCLYMNDTHWTPEGHALAAQAVGATVLAWCPGC